jgi:hypothetical protein
MAVVAIAEALDRIGADIAEDVVERARSEIVRVPSVAQLYEVAREIRIEAKPIQPTLTPGEFLAEMPPDVKERVVAMQDRWASEVIEDREAREAEWQQRMGAIRASSGSTATATVAPSDPCGRCEHPSRRHAAAGAPGWSTCLVREGTDPKTGKPKLCPCDLYWAKP